MKKGTKFILIIILMMALFSGFSYFYIADKLNNKDFYDGIFIEDIELANYTKDQAKLIIREKKQKEISSKEIKVYTERDPDFEFIIPLKDLGYDYNYDKAIEEALSIGKEGNFIDRYRFIKNLENEPIKIGLTYYYDPNSIDYFVDLISEILYEEPKDALLKFDGTNFEITEETIGYEVDKEYLRTIIENNIPNLDDIYVPYIEIKPNVSKELYMRINGLLAHFSTSFETSENGRINNVVLSANSFKGMIVLPGEVVSYNKTTGPRSPQNGYKDAPVIINGELTEGVGGGVCQTSTTLYNALLLADLEILERHPHSIPPAYVPKGTDAAVAGTYYDLVFRNNYDFPIYIDTKIIGKTVHFYIYGDVKSRDYEIKIATEILESKPYNVVEKVNNDLEPGARNLIQEGRNGYKVATYKQKIVNGKIVESIKISSDYYKEKDYIYEVGPEKDDDISSDI